MTVAVAAVSGFLAGRLVWLLVRDVFEGNTFARVNFRGRIVPTAGGAVIPVAVLVVEAGRVATAALGLGSEELSTVRHALLVGVFAFALLGLIDDLGSAGHERGFRGHLSALSRGRLTTGGLKLLGGGAAALAISALFAPASFGRLVIDAAVVALAANAANLLDRAPGRVLKSATAAFAVVAVAVGFSAALVPVAVAVGAAGALFLDDMHERVMIGDTGANAVGAALGIALVASCAPRTRDIGAGVLLVANVGAEFFSFSRVIDAVPPLRLLDRAGRRP